jgi:hypothetical protein
MMQCSSLRIFDPTDAKYRKPPAKWEQMDKEDRFMNFNENYSCESNLLVIPFSNRYSADKRASAATRDEILKDSNQDAKLLTWLENYFNNNFKDQDIQFKLELKRVYCRVPCEIGKKDGKDSILKIKGDLVRLPTRFEEILKNIANDSFDYVPLPKSLMAGIKFEQLVPIGFYKGSKDKKKLRIDNPDVEFYGVFYFDCLAVYPVNTKSPSSMADYFESWFKVEPKEREKEKQTEQSDEEESDDDKDKKKKKKKSKSGDKSEDEEEDDDD